MRDFDPFHNKRLARRGFAQKLLGILGSAGLMGLHRTNRAGERLKAVDYGYGIQVIRRTPVPVEEVEAPVAVSAIVPIYLGYTLEGTLWGSEDGITWVDMTSFTNVTVSGSRPNCMFKYGSTVYWFESATGSNTYWTTTDGLEWTEKSVTGLSGSTITAAWGLSSESRIYVGTRNDSSGVIDVYISGDGGSTWTNSSIIEFDTFAYTKYPIAAFHNYDRQDAFEGPGFVTEGQSDTEGDAGFWQQNDYVLTSKWEGWSVDSTSRETVVDYKFQEEHLVYPGTHAAHDDLANMGLLCGRRKSGSSYFATVWLDRLFFAPAWSSRQTLSTINGSFARMIEHDGSIGSDFYVVGDDAGAGKAILYQLEYDAITGSNIQAGLTTWDMENAYVIRKLGSIWVAGGAPSEKMMYNLSAPEDDEWVDCDWAYGSETIAGAVAL